MSGEAVLFERSAAVAAAAEVEVSAARAAAATAAPAAGAAPLVGAVEMGYGHLRAAHALASAFATTVARVDHEPWANSAEVAVWNTSRFLYERLSRASQWPWIGWPFARALSGLTAIPPLRWRDPGALANAASEAHVPADLFTRTLAQLIERGLGATLAQRLESQGRGLLTTFFTPALAVAHHSADVPTWCVVTDSEVARVWVPRDPAASRIRYLVPSERCRDRLLGYGVPAAALSLTGFPLPPELLGRNREVAKRNLANRLAHLDVGGGFRRTHELALRAELGDDLAGPGNAVGPPRITFAVGGAGAQAHLVDLLLPAVAELVRSGQLALTLVAGTRGDVAERFRSALASQKLAEPKAFPPGRGGDGVVVAGPGEVAILTAPDVATYFVRFNQLLANTDLLWTKPSELTFFAGLGLPIVISPPVGAHEELNRNYLLVAGAGLEPPPWAEVATWLAHGLASGKFAAAAWAGWRRLPNCGVERIGELVSAG